MTRAAHYCSPAVGERRCSFEIDPKGTTIRGRITVDLEPNWDGGCSSKIYGSRQEASYSGWGYGARD